MCLYCIPTCPIIIVSVPSGMSTVRLKGALVDPVIISIAFFGPGKSVDRNERKPLERIVIYLL